MPLPRRTVLESRKFGKPQSSLGQGNRRFQIGVPCLFRSERPFSLPRQKPSREWDIVALHAILTLWALDFRLGERPEYARYLECPVLYSV